MKQPIIIFTRVDGYTEQYFKNLFPNFDGEEEWWNFTQSEKYDLFFVNDQVTAAIPELTQFWQSYLKSKPWIFLHLNRNTAQQERFLTAIFSQYEFYRETNHSPVGDHHNSSGCHYAKILAASEFYASNQPSAMDNQFDLLLNCLND